MIGNPVTGRIVVRLAGQIRTLACDMRAVALLYDEIGEGWGQWLAERFAGTVVRDDSGHESRIVAQIPKADIGLALYALLASDRHEKDSPESLVSRMDDRDLRDAQEAALLAVSPSFGLPGRGFPQRRRRQVKPKPWSWRLVLETALGVMNLEPAVFWSLTLAEWRALSDGFAERQRLEMRKQAWSLSHLLIAAGCKPENVTVSKLMGEKERRRKRAKEEPALSIEEIYSRMRGQGGGAAAAGSSKHHGDVARYAGVPAPSEPPAV